MDIATHALIGSVVAAGTLDSHPALAAGVMVGNVLPDLDAFSRLAGKYAFMRLHQTYTHSLGARSVWRTRMVVPICARVLLFVLQRLSAPSATGVGMGGLFFSDHDRLSRVGLLDLRRHVDGAGDNIRGARLCDSAAELSRNLLSTKVERMGGM
ncbi:metal-dependent hydrolase [Rhodopirellula sallentina]|uniref:Secreted protein n=1 Tax=Rhodopirellula sallentina SM41 TaxID=1263870 RepID=M5UG61_9BACT|nr:metal-dependent hydrolase [Rhodopirellula sallentina]EMI56826.1 secreted protein [Rhodopirellula sallentina SM41]